MVRIALIALVLLSGCVPATAVEHLRLADGERVRGNDAHARNLYREFIERYPDDPAVPQVRFELGKILFEQDNYAAAAREFTFIADGYPRHPVVWNALLYGAIAEARLGHCAAALDYLGRIIRGTENGQAPFEVKARAQRKLDEINEDMQGIHDVCTVKPQV